MSSVENRRSLNSQLPIQRLPPEILALIFKFYEVHEWAGGDVPWIKVTHVCHHWRETALSTPTLWSVIRVGRTTTLERVEVWLLRSQQAALSISGYGTVSAAEIPGRVDVYNAILRHIGRVRELFIYLPSHLIDSLHWPDTPTPNLEILGIKDSEYTQDSNQSPVVFSRLVTLFPRLTGFACYLVPVQLDMWRLPSTLTSLLLWNGALEPRNTYEQVLAALQDLVRLETLDLGRVMSADISLPPASRGLALNLPYLRHITLSEHLLPCADLMNNLTLPNVVHQELKLMLREDSHPSEIAAFVSSWVTRANQPFKSVALTFEDALDEEGEPFEPPRLIFQAWRAVRGTVPWVGNARGNEPDVLLSLETAYIPMEFTWEVGELDALFAPMDLAYVEWLCFNIADGECVILPSTYSKMEAVQQLYLDGEQVPVQELEPLLGNSHSEGITFPNLHTLYIRGVVLDGGNGVEETALEDILQQRQDNGSPLQRLILDNCAVTEAIVTALRRLVAVDWDGHTEIGTIDRSRALTIDDRIQIENLQQATGPAE